MDKSKDKIYVAAKDLIWKNGINDTNVADICEEAGVSKMTFYRKYESKYELLKLIIEDNYNSFDQKYNEIFQKDLPFNEKIMELVFAHSELLKGISEKYLDDIAHQDNAELKEFIQQKQMRYNETVRQLLIREQRKGNIRADVDIEFLNFFRKNILIMLFNPQLKRIYPDTEELIIQLIKMFYFGAVHR